MLCPESTGSNSSGSPLILCKTEQNVHYHQLEHKYFYEYYDSDDNSWHLCVNVIKHILNNLRNFVDLDCVPVAYLPVIRFFSLLNTKAIRSPLQRPFAAFSAASPANPYWTDQCFPSLFAEHLLSSPHTETSSHLPRQQDSLRVLSNQ